MSLALCCAADERAETGRIVTRREQSSPVASVGSVHGYRVESSFDCRFLRAESPAERLVIREAERPPDVDGEPLLAWSPRPLRDFEAKLFTTDGGYVFWTSREGWYDIDPLAPSIAVTPASDRVRREARLWGVPSLLCYLSRGDVPLHAAAVDVGGRALLLAGPGRSGKTTTAAAFLIAGHRVLAEDLVACRPAPPPSLLPGPAMLRVRPDVYPRLRLTNASPVAEDAERVHLALEGAARGDGAPVPLAGIVFLRPGEGAPRLRRRSAEDTIRDLWALSLNLPTEQDRARCFRGVASLAASVPAWDLERAISLDLLDQVVEAVIATCLTPA